MRSKIRIRGKDGQPISIHADKRAHVFLGLKQTGNQPRGVGEVLMFFYRS